MLLNLMEKNKMLNYLKKLFQVQPKEQAPSVSPVQEEVKPVPVVEPIPEPVPVPVQEVVAEPAPAPVTPSTPMKKQPVAKSRSQKSAPAKKKK